MRTRIITPLIVAAFAITACGGGAGGDQGEVADLFIDAMGDEDIDVDRDCVEDAASELSDADAKLLVDAGVDGDPDLSPEAAAIAAKMASCIDTGALVDQMIDELVTEVGEDNVDGDCLRDALGDLDLSDPEDSAITTAMFDCVDLGG